MNKKNRIRLSMLVILVLAAVVTYLLIQAHPEKPKLFRYILGLRIPTLICMMIASVSIGASTMIFQSIVHNTVRNIL